MTSPLNRGGGGHRGQRGRGGTQRNVNNPNMPIVDSSSAPAGRTDFHSSNGEQAARVDRDGVVRNECARKIIVSSTEVD